MPDSTTTAATTQTSADDRGLLNQAATAAVLPFSLVGQLLPDNPVPVALGAGALAVAGVIEWPVAAAVGLGYLALRRWHGPTVGGTPAQ